MCHLKRCKTECMFWSQNVQNLNFPPFSRQIQTSTGNLFKSKTDSYQLNQTCTTDKKKRSSWRTGMECVIKWKKWHESFTGWRGADSIKHLDSARSRPDEYFCSSQRLYSSPILRISNPFLFSKHILSISHASFEDTRMKNTDSRPERVCATAPKSRVMICYTTQSAFKLSVKKKKCAPKTIIYIPMKDFWIYNAGWEFQQNS